MRQRSPRGLLASLMLAMFFLTGCGDNWEVTFKGFVRDAADQPAKKITGNFCWRLSSDHRGCEPFKTNDRGEFTVKKSGDKKLPNVRISENNFYLEINDQVVEALRVRTDEMRRDGDDIKIRLRGFFRLDTRLAGAIHIHDPNSALALLNEVNRTREASAAASRAQDRLVEGGAGFSADSAAGLVSSEARD